MRVAYRGAAAATHAKSSALARARAKKKPANGEVCAFRVARSLSTDRARRNAESNALYARYAFHTHGLVEAPAVFVVLRAQQRRMASRTNAVLSARLSVLHADREAAARVEINLFGAARAVHAGR